MCSVDQGTPEPNRPWTLKKELLYLPWFNRTDDGPKRRRRPISQAIHKKVQESMVKKGVVKDRVQHQSFTWFPQFLCKSDWDLLMNATIPTAQKVSVVMDRLWKLDLRAPNEDTQAMITVCLLLTETQRFSDPVQLRSSYLSVKGLVKSYLKNRLNSVAPTWTHKELPPVVGALEEERLANAYAEGEKPGSLPDGITMEYMMYWMNVVPQRSNSSSIAISLPKTGVFPGMNPYGGMMMGNHGMSMPFQQMPTMLPGMVPPALPAQPQPAAHQLALQFPRSIGIAGTGIITSTSCDICSSHSTSCDCSSSGRSCSGESTNSCEKTFGSYWWSRWWGFQAGSAW